MEEEKITIDVNTLSNQELIATYQELDSFSKYLEDEIKKTDVGDVDEQ